ncbi:MAG: Spy/CpxP family protein refolding chaperone [Alphaproteobacteria bacterium]
MSIRNFFLATFLVIAVPTLAGAQGVDPHRHHQQQHQQSQPGMQPGTPGRPGMMMMMGDRNMMSRMMMMGHMGPRHAHMGMGDGIKHVEGNIAFLKAELKITDAQQKPWDQFADAMRANAKQINEMHGAMMQNMGKPMSMAARLEQQEKMLSVRLDAVKRTRAALTGLVAVLNDDQKKMFDELMPHAPMPGRQR